MFILSWYFVIFLNGTLVGCPSIGISCSFASENKKINFNQALEMVIEQSPQINEMRMDFQMRELEEKNAASVFLPKLDFNAEQTVLDVQPRNRATSGITSELSLQLTENLYDNGQSWNRYQQAKIRKKIAQLKWEDVRDQVLLNVINEYFQYSLNYRLLQIREQQFDTVAHQAALTQKQFQQGIKTQRSYLQLSSELKRAKIDLGTARNSLEKSRLQLLKLMGMNLNSDTYKDFQFEPVRVEVEKITSLPQNKPNLHNHYQNLIVESEQQLFILDHELAARERWPSLFLTLGGSYYMGSEGARTLYDRLQDQGQGRSGEMDWRATIQLRANLWDWGQGKRNETLVELRNQKQAYTQYAQQNELAINNDQTYMDLDQSAKNFKLAQELLDMEVKSYTLLDTEYKNGRVTFTDVVVSLRDLLSAKIQMATTYFDLRNQLMKYHYYEGSLYDFLFPNGAIKGVTK